MKKFIRHLPLLLLWAAFLPMGNAEQYQFRFNQQESVGESVSAKPKVFETESVSVNGVKMRGFSTTFENPREMSVLTYRAKSMQVRIKAEYLKQFEMYAMPNGMVFVPKGWQLASATLGKNGALNYTFVPSSGDGYLSFTHNAGCVSCAMHDASLFFSQANEDAKTHGVQIYTGSNIELNIASVKPNLATFRGKQGEKRLDGIVFYNPHSQVPYWKAEVSLPTTQPHLINPLLNQFISKYE